MFKRRIGLDPHHGGRKTESLHGCPDIWELDDGNFAIIGEEMTALALPLLPPTAGCGEDEAVIRVPRRLLVEARKFIPTS